MQTLEELQRRLAEEMKAETDARAIYDQANIMAAEYQRQSSYHASNGNYDKSKSTDAWRDAEVDKANRAKMAMETARKNVSAILTQIENLKATMSPEQIRAIELELEKTEQKLVSQKTTTYLIWGGIALVVIVVGIIIFRKQFAA